MRKLLSIHNVTAIVILTALAGCGANGANVAPAVSAVDPSRSVLASAAPSDSAVAIAAPTSSPATTQPSPASATAAHSDLTALALSEVKDTTPTAVLSIERKIEDRAEAEPTNLGSQFDLQLLRLIQNQPAQASDALPQDERQVLTFVTDALTAFRRSAGEEKSRLATKVEPLKELSDRLSAAEPMSIPTLALCRAVTQFGVYDAFDPPRFTAGKDTAVIIYCELDNFLSRAASDGRWETRLTYEATLYADGDAGVSVISKKPTNIVDRCRNRRRDFFLADRMTIPASLPVGRYLLKVTVVDQAANHVAERTLPIMVAPN